MRQVITFVLSLDSSFVIQVVPPLTRRNKCSSLLRSVSQLFFDSLSSDNTAFLRRSASKTTKVHGKRRDSQGGAKKK